MCLLCDELHSTLQNLNHSIRHTSAEHNSRDCGESTQLVHQLMVQYAATADQTLPDKSFCSAASFADLIIASELLNEAIGEIVVAVMTIPSLTPLVVINPKLVLDCCSATFHPHQILCMVHDLTAGAEHASGVHPPPVFAERTIQEAWPRVHMPAFMYMAPRLTHETMVWRRIIV
jgi:hypothetical protein